MVVVSFLTEFSNNINVHVPVSLTNPAKAPTLDDFVNALRDKLGIARSAAL